MTCSQYSVAISAGSIDPVCSWIDFLGVWGMSQKKLKRLKRRDSIHHDLAAWLTVLRTREGLTQTELAERLGVTQTALSRTETRDDLPLSVLSAYIHALGGSLSVSAVFPNSAVFPLLGAASADANLAINSKQGSSCLPLEVPDDPRQLSLAGIRNDVPRKDIVFSIRPEHAVKILAGVKKIELRRRFTDEIGSGSRAFIYCTSPISALTGLAQIGEVRRMPVKRIWRNHRIEACVDKLEFETYFSGCDHGYAIFLNTAEPLLRPVGLAELRKRFGFGPPQSYLYAPPKLLKYFGNGQLQASY
jgi:predicted transcriptional regulator/DNA-binding XRE family transcriptional regulator